MSSDSRQPDSSSVLPPGWSRGFSKSQKRHYYFHSETKHTQWHFPTASEASDPLKAKRRADMNVEREKAQRRTESVAKSSSDLGDIVSEIKVEQAAKRARTTPHKTLGPDEDLELADATSVAIIVPYRDLHPSQHRAKHLQQFVPHMQQFLTSLVKQKRLSDYGIYIIEQSNDGRKFNRGKLLNIGFDLARKSKRRHDVFIFHDVDLLPSSDLEVWYSKFPKVPVHIARVWDRYSNNPKYFGGVVSFSLSDYKRINGYPNTFWGWGGEDDEMQKRLEKLGIKWEWPDDGTIVDLEDMSLKEKLDFLRSNKEWKCMVKWEALDEHESTWKSNGLADLSYTVVGTKDLDDTKRATKITVDIKLNGNHWANAKAGVDYRGD